MAGDAGVVVKAALVVVDDVLILPVVGRERVVAPDAGVGGYEQDGGGINVAAPRFRPLELVRLLQADDAGAGMAGICPRFVDFRAADNRQQQFVAFHSAALSFVWWRQLYHPLMLPSSRRPP